MADDSGQRTEKPTPRRLEKARRKGNFPFSREFVSSVQFLGSVACVTWFGASQSLRMAALMRTLFASAFSADLGLLRIVGLARNTVAPTLVPMAAAGFAILLLTMGAQLASTRMGMSPQKLVPDLQRLNPVNRLASMPSQNLFLLAQAVALMVVVGVALWHEISENLDPFLELSWLAPKTAASRVGGALGALLWRAASSFLFIGFIDLIWNRLRYTRQLRMTKQEIREEVKEQEGSPHVKGRIRRIQRDLARRKMMREIPKATAVIVNPTHYAVAIRYSTDSPGAPRVIAKGRNYLAKRIRQRAIEHQVPIVENPPLARALYSSADVGQEIPSHLYRAVAEILAYIYKLMNGRLPG
jgi:flagellar biosynthetic protein FlhB